MSSQTSPEEVDEQSFFSLSTTAINGSFGTPASRFNDLSSSDGFCTPTRTPVRNPRLDILRTGSQETGRSPALKIPESPVMRRLGYGTGVDVYLLERSPMMCGNVRSPWAIKKTKGVTGVTTDDNENDNEVYKGRIEYEAEILKKLSHPNIIGYRGFGQTSPGDTYLAMEKASQSLSDLIEERVDEILVVDKCDSVAPFSADKIVKVALDVAKALTYLHDEVKMVHGDLKSANVLIFGDFERIKLCDFGVARRLSKDGTVEGFYVGTEIWCALEVIRQKRGHDHVPVTQKADIFPFGLTIYEMITLKPPHLSSAEDSILATENSLSATDKSTSSDISFDELAYEEALSRYVGTRPPLPDIEFDPSYTAILGIFYCCTEEDPTRRPDAKDIVSALSDQH